MFNNYYGNQKADSFLKSPLAENSSADFEDVVKVKTALGKLGFYEPEERVGESKDNISQYPSTNLFDGIRKYQKAKGLTVDGVMNPQGETESSLKQVLSGAGNILGSFANGYSDAAKSSKSNSSFKGLNDYLSSNSSVDNDDVLNVKNALVSTGHYEPNKTFGESSSNLSKYPDNSFFDAIKSFQKDNGLTVDGIMKKGGETERVLRSNLIEPSKEKKERLQKTGLYDGVMFMNENTSNKENSDKDTSQENESSTAQAQETSSQNEDISKTSPKEDSVEALKQATNKIVDEFVKNISEKYDIKKKETLKSLDEFARKYIESYRIFDDQKELMQKENISGNDKFNHCEANRKVLSERGQLLPAAVLSVGKEFKDIGKKWDKIPLKESLKDSLEDLEADLHGIGYGMEEAFKKLLGVETTENRCSKYDKRNNKQNLKK